MVCNKLQSFNVFAKLDEATISKGAAVTFADDEAELDTFGDESDEVRGTLVPGKSEKRTTCIVMCSTNMALFGLHRKIAIFNLHINYVSNSSWPIKLLLKRFKHVF